MENENPQTVGLPRYLLPLLVVSILLSLIAVVLSVFTLVRPVDQPTATEISQDAEMTEIECSDSIPCSGDFVCEDGQCVGAAECLSNKDCESGECYKGTCQEAGVPSTDGLSSYSNQILQLSFVYPEDWNISEDSSQGHVLLKANGFTFFSADSYPYTGPDRGAGWIDLPHAIEDQGMVDNFCVNPFTIGGRELPSDQLGSCENLVNKNGISYTKAYQEIQSEGGSQGWAYNYYFFNEASEDFSGIVLSTVFLDDYEPSEVEQFLDQIANSMQFGL